jgi:Tfp pilus assembly protein PilZ
MQDDGADKRQSPRYKTRVFGVFSKDIDLDETEMLMMNMSLGGAFVRTETPSPPGTPVMLRVYEHEDSTPLPIMGEVVWSRLPGQGQPVGMGVKFTQIGPGDLPRYKSFLAQLVEEDLFGA